MENKENKPHWMDSENFKFYYHKPKGFKQRVVYMWKATKAFFRSFKVLYTPPFDTIELIAIITLHIALIVTIISFYYIFTQLI